MGALELFWFDSRSSDDDAYRPRSRIPIPPDDAPRLVPDADAALLEQLRAGDEGALERLVQQYLDLLLRVAGRLGYHDDAGQDVVQDVLVRLWDQRATLTVRTTLRGYLVAAVRNQAISGFRHTRTVGNAIREFERAGESPTAGMIRAPDLALEDAELHAALQAALGALPPRMRQVAMLRWQDQLSRREIAEILGTSEATVRNQLHTLVRLLRTRLASFFE